MKKNFFSAFIYFIVFALVFSAVISVAATSFKDVPEDAYYADAAERMADRGILSGFGDGCYYGDQSITRAQVAALVCKMLGKVDEATALAGKTAFTDVPETSWCTGYVNYAVANGIINGDGDGRFRPDDYVKYEEVVKVIVCVLGLDEGVNINPSDWSKEYIEAADAANLLRNILSKKGEFMLRSDIAVICDSAMKVLDDNAEAEPASSVTTTKKKVVDDDDDDEDEPEETTKKTTTKVTTEKTNEPEDTTTEKTTAQTTTAETTTAETTTKATTEKPVHTAPVLEPNPNEGDDIVDPDYTTNENEGELV